MKWHVKINNKECHGLLVEDIGAIYKLTVKKKDIFHEKDKEDWFFLELYKSVNEIRWYRVYVNADRKVIGFERIER